MPPLTQSQIIFIARQHLEAGRLPEAEGLCAKILAREPRCAEALHMAGLAAERRGRLEEAAEMLRRAAAAAPNHVACHADLGRVLRRLRRVDEAAAALGRAAELSPDDVPAAVALAEVLLDAGRFADAAERCRAVLERRPGEGEIYVLQGDALQGARQFDEAEAAYRRAVALGPGEAARHAKLGAALLLLNRFDDAIAALNDALTINPRLHEALDALGQSLQKTGRLEEAAAAFERAAEVDPRGAGPLVRLGNVLVQLGLADRARGAFRQAITLAPDSAEVLAQIDDTHREEVRLDAVIAACLRAIEASPGDVRNYFALGVACQQGNLPDEAEAAYRKTLELDPGQLAGLNNLGVVLKDTGRLDESIECFRLAVERHPRVSTCHSNLLYMLHFHPGYDAPSIYREHIPWRVRHADPLKSTIGAHLNERSPNRRLRIGYVSPNLCNHPVGRFMATPLACHDHGNFEVICYASVRKSDGVTGRLREGADAWVDTLGMTDEALAERVRADRIDILVDLAMHMNHTRLMTFARKPAPVQVTYLAYCSTTGLETMDYRITDPYLDPPPPPSPPPAPGGAAEETLEIYGGPRYTERSVRMGETYWCYEPPGEVPEVGALPAAARGYVTFGSLNNFCKLSPAALALWVRLMAAVEKSRLVVHAHPGAHRQRVLDLFASGGVDPARLRFVGMLSLPEFLKVHHDIDLMLDSFPYPGGTTTCDALWMGVPVVSLVGAAAYMRSGLSILSNIGLPELAVGSEDEYLATAAGLAGDLPRLALLRATMRERIRGSPLMDGPRFTRDLERIYRGVWGDWCERTGAIPNGK